MHKPDICGRLSKLRRALAEKSLDAALITKRENYLYLSGFTGSSAWLIITQKEAILVTDFRYREQATRQAQEYRVVQYEGSILDSLRQLLKENNVERLGFEEGYMTWSAYRDYSSKLEVRELLPLEGVVENLRLIKERSEIELITRAVQVADQAFEHILDYIKPGVTELEIAAELEYFMKRQGAIGPSFETIVASGLRSSMPHGTASEKKLAVGEAITLDFGALFADYCSDMTRTVFLGKPTEQLIRIYDTVLGAQLEALKGAHRGHTGKEIDSIARDIISSSGYEKNFGHGLGHGVGLEIHEEPRLSPSGAKVMENGMAVTIEPGIYVDGTGGVRIEDIVIINNDSPVILTRSTKEMIIL